VAERGQQSAAVQVDDLGPRTALGHRVLVEPAHQAVGDRDGGDARTVGVGGADGPAGEHEVCWHARILARDQSTTASATDTGVSVTVGPTRDRRHGTLEVVSQPEPADASDGLRAPAADPRSTDDLLRAVGRGDARAFELLYDRVAGSVLGMV